MFVGLAENVSVGGSLASTATDTVRVTEPEVPMHVSVNAVVLYTGPVEALPAPSRGPDHPPAAEHDVTFELDQSSVEALPTGTLAGLAVKLSVGGETAATSTVVADRPVPPSPVHARLNVVADVKASMLSLPSVDLLPVQPPVASQVVAFVLDQCRVVAPPMGTVVGSAAIETTGSAVLPETLTVTVRLIEPLSPVHSRVKEVASVRGTVVSLPEVSLAPSQPPDAVQAETFRLDHSSTALLPGVTGFVRRETARLSLGLASGPTDSAPAATGTTTVLDTDLPSTLQVMVKTVSLLKGADASSPVADLDPDHPPVA